MLLWWRLRLLVVLDVGQINSLGPVAEVGLGDVGVTAELKGYLQSASTL
jgi:hypothetical protein